jgi:hypothetical protein
MATRLAFSQTYTVQPDLLKARCDAADVAGNGARPAHEVGDMQRGTGAVVPADFDLREIVPAS